MRGISLFDGLMAFPDLERLNKIHVVSRRTSIKLRAVPPMEEFFLRSERVLHAVNLVDIFLNIRPFNQKGSRFLDKICAPHFYDSLQLAYIFLLIVRIIFIFILFHLDYNKKDCPI